MSPNALPGAFWRLASPGIASKAGMHTSGSALAVIEVHGDCDTALRRAGFGDVGVGNAVLRSIPGVDDLVVARPSRETCLLFPHGGKSVVGAVRDHLTRHGLSPVAASMHQPSRFESRDDVESAALDALDRTRSPLALAVLLDQPRRWREFREGKLDSVGAKHANGLRRLLDPPLVVAVGPPNVGKSSLLNALARDQLAVVADVPGTTRDAVGVMLDLDGLVVRFADTPGLSLSAASRASVEDTQAAIDRRAEIAAIELIKRADMLLVCGDPLSGFLEEPSLESIANLPKEIPCLRVLLRADLLDAEPGPPLGQTRFVADVSISLVFHGSSEPAGAGLARLATMIRRALLPDEAVNDPGAWKFWDR